MKIAIHDRQVLLVTFPDGLTKEFSGQEALVNHLTSQVKGKENCIEYYLKQVEQLKAELAPQLKQLEIATKMKGLP